MEAVYAKLAPFFARLYFYDVEGQSLRQLKEVLTGLEQQEALGQNAQVVFNRLEARSKGNVEKIIKQKKERKGKAKNNDYMFEKRRDAEGLIRTHFLKDKGNINDSMLESSVLINETMIEQHAQEKLFVQIQRKSGKIYNGELVISLKLSDLIRAKEITTEFCVNPRVKESSITFETLKELNLQSKNPSLIVDNRKEKFNISNKNTLGLLFLQKNNIIIQCNFRAQKSSFELIYTQ